MSSLSNESNSIKGKSVVVLVNNIVVALGGSWPDSHSSLLASFLIVNVNVFGVGLNSSIENTFEGGSTDTLSLHSGEVLVDLRNDHDEFDWVNSTIDDHHNGLNGIVHGISSILFTGIRLDDILTSWFAVSDKSLSSGKELGSIEDKFGLITIFEISDNIHDISIDSINITGASSSIGDIFSLNVFSSGSINKVLDVRAVREGLEISVSFLSIFKDLGWINITRSKHLNDVKDLVHHVFSRSFTSVSKAVLRRSTVSFSLSKSRK